MVYDAIMLQGSELGAGPQDVLWISRLVKENRQIGLGPR